METMDDKTLVDHIRQGGKKAEQAFMQLDQQLRPIMHKVLQTDYANVNRAEREDIIQQAFITVFQQIRNDSFRGDASIKNWAMVILKHKAIDFLRKTATKDNAVQSLKMNVAATITERNEAMYEYDDIDCEKRALNAFRQENVKVYADFLQIVVRGLTVKQFAAMEQIKHGTARERMSSLRKKLRIYIERFCGKYL